VADDLLKNDRKKFIEMMEQSTKRRMAREDAQFSNPNYCHPPNDSVHIHSHNHNHPPQLDNNDEYDDDYSSQNGGYGEEELVSVSENFGECID